MEKILLTAIMSLSLSACSMTSKELDKDSLSVYQEKILKEDQRTNEILAKAAALSAKSLAVFVRTEQALHQKSLTSEQIRQARFQAEYIPVNMEQKVEYSWDSAPEPLIRSLADDAGYELEYMNERPPIPISVSISSKIRTIEAYFKIIEDNSVGYIARIDRDDKTDRKIVRVYYSAF